MTVIDVYMHFGQGPDRLDDWAAPFTTSLLEQHPDCVVFSSDYAQTESDTEPSTLQNSPLAEVQEKTSAGCLDGNIAECFARVVGT